MLQTGINTADILREKKISSVAVKANTEREKVITICFLSLFV